MRTGAVVHVVHVHAEGEVGDVVVGGVAPPPGDSVWEQSRFIARDNSLRNFLLNEPRGGVFRHYNLLVPPKTPGADVGFIIMEPADTPPMSGSNAMCVATVVLETGIVSMIEPVTELVLEAPAGLVRVQAHCSNGKVTSVDLENIPSFVVHDRVPLEVEGMGTISATTAFGGDSFVMADAPALGFELVPSEAADLVSVGMRIRAAANEQLTFRHPLIPEWTHHSFTYFTGPLDVNQDGVLTSKNVCVINPGKLDRSPTGTGCSALMAILYSRGQLSVGDKFIGRSIIDSEFTGTISAECDLEGIKAIIPKISGKAWLYGASQFYLDPSDPWPEGYRVSDTWPNDLAQ
jgi:trans-L-3-hydroxyproline dehydratase